jgi:hypothetical protein
MLSKCYYFTLLIILLTGACIAAETAVVFDFEGIGVDQQTVVAASQIFRSDLGSSGKFTVMPKADMEAKLSLQGITDATCHEVTCAAGYGAAVGVTNAVIGSLTKLGEKITAEVRLVDVATKAVVFSDRFAATSLDDLDVTLRKLAVAVANRQTIESEVTRFAITEQETQEAPRKKAFITTGASFGFGWPLGKSYSKVDNLKTLAWVMRYEAGKFVIDNSIGISWGSGDPDTVNHVEIDKTQISIVPWDIGLRYVFNYQSDFSPFVGGGLGIHFIGSQSAENAVYVKSDQAFALHLAGGLYAFQSYDFRLTVEAKYTAVFTKAFNDSGSSSHQIGISLGISRKIEKGEKRGCMSGGCLF